MLSRIWPRACLPAWFESDGQICAATQVFFCVWVFGLLRFYATHYFLRTATSMISDTLIPLSSPLDRFVRVLKLLRVLRLLRSINRKSKVTAGGDVFRSVIVFSVLGPTHTHTHTHTHAHTHAHTHTHTLKNHITDEWDNGADVCVYVCVCVCDIADEWAQWCWRAYRSSSVSPVSFDTVLPLY